ncbi:glycosyltransferase family 2 protein [Acinetobacter rathckeae]|uniref:glycosyltransferase family 2 protein n=1 Tax=Acinetobacter rathckeae TaxID=2605272 RepID=UPI0018A27B57|nr:glycosyltransferase [Acinetobacter rathckeae]MBF7688987.1 glycosyltransferase [Acinetobacter rathckeae]
MNKKISFVVLTWNRSQMLERSLIELYSSIKNKEYCNIIIFDNASTDNTKEVISAFYNNYSSNIEIICHFSEVNLRLKAYKKLFKLASIADIIVEFDDDVLAFPENVDEIFIQYLESFTKFGFLALNVIQNEHTNGAKPDISHYKEVNIDKLVVEKGPTGGWCSGFRSNDFKKISWLFNLMPISMKSGEDGALQNLFKLLGKGSGIIKEHKCFHAAGPYYSQQFNLLERDIEKYKAVGLDDFVNNYKNFKE